MATVSSVVYVDDLVMVGTEFLVDIIAEIRKDIKMDGPADLQKYLGCVHHVTQKMVEGETIANVTFDMHDELHPGSDRSILGAGHREAERGTRLSRPGWRRRSSTPSWLSAASSQTTLRA